MSGRSRSTARSRLPTPPRAGTPTPVSRFTWASSQARASAGIERHSGAASVDVDRRAPAPRRARDRRRHGRRRARRRARARARAAARLARAPLARVTSVRIERLASLFALRISPEDGSGRGVHREIVGSRTRRARRYRATTRGGSNPRATTTTPLRSRTACAARTGAAACRARWRARRGAESDPRVGAALHQLEVVVAEAPEEPLGAIERARVVVGVERRRRVRDQRGEAGEHRAVERLGDRVRRWHVVTDRHRARTSTR